jgi:hypothetical protein
LTSAELLERESYDTAVITGIFVYETVAGKLKVSEDEFENDKVPTIILKSPSDTN